jgi:tetratricopeptide (TPR) repeat protein
LKREEEAIDAYQQAIKLDPDYSWPYQNLGAIYEARDDYEEALVYYQRAIGKQ